MKAYQVPNPLWLSDTFIFMEHREIGTFVYVKVNYHNKIEEIGIDIERRLHGRTLDIIKQLYGFKEATPLYKSILNRIGDEYWRSIKRQNDYEQKEIQESLW